MTVSWDGLHCFFSALKYIFVEILNFLYCTAKNSHMSRFIEAFLKGVLKNAAISAVFIRHKSILYRGLTSTILSYF